MDPRQIVRTLLENRSRLTGYAMAILRSGNDTDDVFQDLCLRAMAPGQRFDSVDHLVHWAMQVTRNLSIDLLRRGSRATLRLDDAVLDAFEHQFRSIGVIDRDLDEALEHCVGKLTESQREVLDLRYRGNLPGETIASQTGKSREAVYKSLARIHAALYRCITGRLGVQTEGNRDA